MNDPQPSLTSTPPAVEPEPSRTGESYGAEDVSDSRRVRVYDRPERMGRVSPLIILTALVVAILLAIFVFQFIF